MAWIFDTYSMNKGHSVLGVVTGKPLTIGGSLGREEATARGALYCMREAVREAGISLHGHARRRCRASATSARFLAKFLAEEGAKVIAISDSTGGALQPERDRRAGRVRAQARDRHARRACAAPRRSRTRSCCCSTATCSRRARSSR